MLESYIRLAPILPDLLGTKDVIIWATDEDKYVLLNNYPGYDIGMKEGSVMPKEDTARLAMQSGESISRIVPKEVFGRELRTYVVPVEGGCVGITFDNEDVRQVSESVQGLVASSQQISASTAKVASGADDFARLINNVNETTHEAIQQGESIEKVIATIKEIVDRLGLLSLNSMIEAARAGEHGRSFSVVANEMKKLSTQGEQYVKEVNNVLQSIREMLKSIHHSMEEVNEKGLEQANVSQEIAEATSQIASAVEQVEKMTERLR